MNLCMLQFSCSVVCFVWLHTVLIDYGFINDNHAIIVNCGLYYDLCGSLIHDRLHLPVDGNIAV